MQSLLETVSSIGKVSDVLKADLNEKLIHENFKKKDIILEQGKICNKLYFVTKGLLRAYYMVDGKDVSSFFMDEGDFVISVLSFFKRQASYESIEALEDTETTALHFDDLKELYHRHVEFNVIGRLLTEQYYCLSEERLIGLRSKRASDRFEFLVDSRPGLLNRVPAKHLASYLGIAPETFSRMRANYFMI